MKKVPTAKNIVIQKESASFEVHNKLGGSLRFIDNNAKNKHKSTDPVKPYGYKRDILFGSGKPYSTGHLKDL